MRQDATSLLSWGNIIINLPLSRYAMVALGYAWSHTSAFIWLDMTSPLPVFNDKTDGILWRVPSDSITIYLWFSIIIIYLFFNLV